LFIYRLVLACDKQEDTGSDTVNELKNIKTFVIQCIVTIHSECFFITGMAGGIPYHSEIQQGLPTAAGLGFYAVFMFQQE
jgi:hypothetical protein